MQIIENQKGKLLLSHIYLFCLLCRPCISPCYLNLFIFSPKDFWHRLHCLFWHMKTKYFILIALSPNTFLKTPQQTSSVRVNKCISSLLTDHSAIHYAIAFLKSFLSSASFQMAIKRVTKAWCKISSIWILSLFLI